jgi:tight adherence protein B
MSNRLTWAAAAAAVALVVVPAASASVELAQVQRVPFPKRAYIVDIGRDGALSASQMHVSENGAPVSRFALRPLAGSSINSAVVLAIDASNSMAGRPYRAAIAAAGAFARSRTGSERIGLVAFNDVIQVAQPPTSSPGDLSSSLRHPPALAYGTHIYDAVMQSVQLLSEAHVSTGAIVLLSDGADVGSVATLDEAISAARSQHVRVFTVGLVSRSYDPATLRRLAAETGGWYSEALSAGELSSIYSALGHRLASQYLLSYRSEALPNSAVTLRVVIDGAGSTAVDYTAPERSGIAPFHRSFFKRLLLSPAATVLLSLLLAAMLGGLFLLLLTRTRSGVVGRIEEFLDGVRREKLRKRSEEVRVALMGSPRAQGWLSAVERDLEISGIQTSATKVAMWTAATSLIVSVVLALISPILILAGLATPLLVRAWIRRKLRSVREDFADQLPPNLQVLASAMRAGHSFSGAMAVMVENAADPSQRELRRAVKDDQLGIPTDEALRRVADRMKSRDLQQVALLSELQRTAGGNAAEVLDTVVETIRERADVRRLLRTLTAQGRMARWILTALPIGVAGFLTLIQPQLMQPLYTTTGGHIALLIAALMVMAGSAVIQRIVDIEV